MTLDSSLHATTSWQITGRITKCVEFGFKVRRIYIRGISKMLNIFGLAKVFDTFFFIKSAVEVLKVRLKIKINYI